MRKWITGLLILLAAALGGIYIFIPAQLNITKISPVSCTQSSAYSFLADQNKWHLWWPAGQGDSFSCNGYTYRLNERLYNVVTLAVRHDGQTSADTIAILPINKDSVYIKWYSVLSTGNNPFTKIQHYQQAASRKKNMDSIVASLASFLENSKNVYGTSINKTKVKDTLLIATKTEFSTYPGTTEIYQLINRLKSYAQQQGAKETGYPMLNILVLDSTRFETMTALPVDKPVDGQKDIYVKQMIPGNILVTETRGGIYSINKAARQLERYVNDHKMESPAIPFQSLITDRSAEPDTSKWITRLYYPVF